MERIPNPEMDRRLLDHLSTKYKLKHKREGIHLSTLVTCITKGWLDHSIGVEPTDSEIMLFSTGVGLQDELTPPDAEAPIFMVDGITFRPDFYFPISNTHVEFKSTRASLKKNKVQLPQAWIDYIMGGCYMRKVTTYELSALHLMGSYAPPFPEIYSETLVFEQAELDEFWKVIIRRRDEYQHALEVDKPPTPFLYCKEWECKNCRHKLVCDTIAAAEAKEDIDPYAGADSTDVVDKKEEDSVRD